MNVTFKAASDGIEYLNSYEWNFFKMRPLLN